MMGRVIILPTVLLLLTSLTSTSSSSRSSLRIPAGDRRESPDAAVDLNATNFDVILRDTPASYAIVEFFAHWCPACRNYKLHYEKVAKLFNGPTAVHPGVVVMARVDCALKTNAGLCDRFTVRHYPMLLWGEPASFLSRASNATVMISDGKTSQQLLKWINTRLKSSFDLDDENFENEYVSVNASDPGQIARALYDVEEATATAFGIIMEHKMIKAGTTRVSLIKFLQVLAVHHPSRRCRKGSADILMNFNDAFPSDSNARHHDNNNNDNNNVPICGNDVPRGYWMFCRGSKKEHRGFSCGLWVLLHSLTVRVEDGESHFLFTAMCDFIHEFFICEECRQHFYEMCSGVVAFTGSRELVLWLWRAHNEVNGRVMKEEALLGTGDPAHRKTAAWPTRQLCASCGGVGEREWDEDEVFDFLSRHYGTMLVSAMADRDKEVNFTVGGGEVKLLDEVDGSAVPVRAALAVASACCAFGALAYYWRKRQKNQKYFHQLHSLKTI